MGFVPLTNPGIPKMEFDDRRRKEFRGEEAALGDTTVSRMGQKWAVSLEMPFFTESGSSKGITGTLFKHFFGKSVSVQNAATGQYSHMMYPVANPFAEANLGQKALTLNLNINEGAVMSNWPFTGGRVKSLSFEQEAGNALKLTAELFGQKRDAAAPEIGNPLFASEGLRCDYNNLKLYTGPITRSGPAPDYTGFAFSGATLIKPDKVSLKLENGMEDVLRLSGADYPDLTRMGQYKASFEITIDWEDPSNGFSSIAEFRNWAASSGETGFFLHWDTGTQAGTGDNHALYADLPRMQRTGGEPEYKLDKDPMITLKYEGLYDGATARYMIGLMLKNTAPAI